MLPPTRATEIDLSAATAVPIPLRIAVALETLAAATDTTFALRSVDEKYRFKEDGTFQLYNADTTMYHTISLSGADGAVTIDIAAGEV